MIRTRTLLVPFALCAMGMLGVFSGCKKKAPEAAAKPTPAVSPAMSTPEERMADKEYVKQLDAQGAEMKRLAKRLNAATNAADRAVAAQLLEANRLRTAEIVRARMAVSNKEISK